MSASEDEPVEIKDIEGRWDERIAYAVLVIPFLLVTIGVVAIAGLVTAGQIPVNVSIEGTVSATQVISPLILVFGGLLALTWLLSLMKVFGIHPVIYVVERIANASKNYNPDDDNQ